MKAESILACNAAVFEKIGLKQGLNMIHVDQLIPLIQNDLVIGQREALEVDESKRQLLPGLVLTRPNVKGETTFFAYQRGKGVGEQRLAGGVTVVLGGHVDLADIVHKDSVIDVGSTLIQGVARELQEEVVFSGAADNDLGISSLGAVIDDTNAVGRVHIGLIMTAALESHVNVECAEEELETLGFFTPQELLDSGLPLENWATIICQFFVDHGL